MKNLSFSNLNLSDATLRALSDMGFEEPTPVQQECIPHILNGKDIVGQAQTGTGKTAAFGVPLIENIDTNNPNTQALIQCPTRELAIQVTGELMKIGQHADKLNVVPVYGGQPIKRQIKSLKQGAQIVVGTPGRTIDHLKRGTINIEKLQMIVFDEADEMLNMGFRDDMEKILSYANGSVQTIMFSATVPKSIRKIMNRYMDQPETVTIERESIAAPNIDQYVVEVRDSVRTEAVCRFMDVKEYELALIFCNTKRKTEKLTRELKSRGYTSDFINGDLNQNQRDRVMNKFRKGHIDILVATDVAARGIDVDNIDVVFNYDVPQDPEYYVHRIGRTGRYGQSGTAITFTAGRKNKQLRYIEKKNKIKLKKMSMPSNSDVWEFRMEDQLNDLVQTLEKGGLRPYIEQIEAAADGRFTPVEMAAALLKNKLDKKDKAVKTNGTQSREVGGMVRLRFDVGYNHKVGPGHLVGAITGETGVSGNVIGDIDIQKDHALVEIPGQQADKIQNVMNQNRVKGRRVKVNVV